MDTISEEKKAELERLAQRPDEEIDLPDIPDIRELPADARIGAFFRTK